MTNPLNFPGYGDEETWSKGARDYMDGAEPTPNDEEFEDFLRRGFHICRDSREGDEE